MLDPINGGTSEKFTRPAAEEIHARTAGQRDSTLRYVLVTPARNEAAYIGLTLKSMVRQTVLPLKWVIVDDGSTDETASLVRKYATACPWIELLQRPQRIDRSFSAKVQAFNAGYERLRDVDYEILGNLDADLSFDADHFELLLGKFSKNRRLGVAGTVFKEDGYDSASQSFEGRHHVAGGCQLFRRTCFEQIGGFRPNRAGGVDWMAVTTARMMGWETRSFRERAFFHHRHLGTAGRAALVATFSYGEKDYYLGGHPIWELFRVAYRATKRPYFADGLALGLGYCWAFLRRTPRPVSKELLTFHRREQMAKLRAILGTAFRLKRIDNFTLGSED